MSMTFDQIKALQPQRYEIRSDGTFAFLLKDGRWVDLKCDKCGNPIWQIGYVTPPMPTEEMNFLLICNVCGKGTRWITIGPPKKP